MSALARAALLAALATAGCRGRYDIPSSAMEPTLIVGDKIEVRGLDDGEPRRGDIVVFEYRNPDPLGASPMLERRGATFGKDPMDGNDFVKRVIAVGGDRVRLEANRVVLNGQPIDTTSDGLTKCPLHGQDYDPEPRGHFECERQRESIGVLRWQTQHAVGDGPMGMEPQPDWPQAVAPRMMDTYLGSKGTNPTFPDVVVPDGFVFVMGDNRDQSKDGRYIGFVPLSRIRGKVTRIVSNRFDDAREDLALD